MMRTVPSGHSARGACSAEKTGLLKWPKLKTKMNNNNDRDNTGNLLIMALSFSIGLCPASNAPPVVNYPPYIRR
jgi:hypothetical protein